MKCEALHFAFDRIEPGTVIWIDTQKQILFKFVDRSMVFIFVAELCDSAAFLPLKFVLEVLLFVELVDLVSRSTLDIWEYKVRWLDITFEGWNLLGVRIVARSTIVSFFLYVKVRQLWNLDQDLVLVITQSLERIPEFFVNDQTRRNRVHHALPSFLGWHNFQLNF